MFGVGVEVPKPSANDSGTHVVSEDPGHTFAYLKDKNGNIVNITSFGPGEQLGSHNKSEFQKGQIPGNPNWPLQGNANVQEWPISDSQLQQGDQIMTDFRNNPPNYTPDSHCTTAAIDVGQQIGVAVPDGRGPVSVKAFGFTVHTEPNAVSPMHLNNQLSNTQNMPVTVFQNRLRQIANQNQSNSGGTP
jgi:hypothetical protein